MKGRNMSLSHSDPRAIYELLVRGELDQNWEAWFSGLAVTGTHAGERPPTTTLIGPVADQAALRGLLCKLWDLNLTLISVRRVEADGKEEYQND
jgi:hypothetical protein